MRKSKVTESQIVGILKEAEDLRVLSRELRTDTGPEFAAQPVVDWCEAHNVALHYIQPGKLDQNALHRTLQSQLPHEVLDA